MSNLPNCPRCGFFQTIIDQRNGKAFCPSCQRYFPPKRNWGPWIGIGLFAVVLAIVGSRSSQNRKAKEKESSSREDREERDPCARPPPGFYGACKELVRKQLVSPSSADFPSFPPKFTKEGKCGHTGSFTFESKNRLGVMLLGSAVCTYKYWCHFWQCRLMLLDCTAIWQ
jgi:hypothetical protein